MHGDDATPVQRTIDFTRGEQRAILNNAELPQDAKDKWGKGVKANVLKGVLRAIDDFGRGRDAGAYPSIDTLAKSACIGRRTCQRAVEVLEQIGVLCVEQHGRRGRMGSPTNTYTIVWSELSLLVDRGPLWRKPPPDQSATRGALVDARLHPDQSATGADQSATRTNQSATGADQSATRGTQNDKKRQESYKKRRQTFVRHESDGAVALVTVDGSDDVDGARYFFGDEIAAVRELANKLAVWACPRTLADRELVLKIATLRHDGEIPEDAFHQVLESYRAKREKREPIAKPMGWLWTTLRGQCRRHRVRIEQLLAATEFPLELLAPAAPPEQVEDEASL